MICCLQNRSQKLSYQSPSFSIHINHMNIHPIIVHFPIALLILYSILEITSAIFPNTNRILYTTKIICLWWWTIGSFAALFTGEMAQEALGQSSLIHTHEERAEKAHSLYIILSIYYSIKIIIEQEIWIQYRTSTSKHHISQMRSFFSSRWTAAIISIMSIIGIWLLTVVWALGGAIVRGTGSGDPISDWAVNMLVPSWKTQ